jgi:hypothetical protein
VGLGILLDGGGVNANGTLTWQDVSVGCKLKELESCI